MNEWMNVRHYRTWKKNEHFICILARDQVYWWGIVMNKLRIFINRNASMHHTHLSLNNYSIMPDALFDGIYLTIFSMSCSVTAWNSNLFTFCRSSVVGSTCSTDSSEKLIAQSLGCCLPYRDVEIVKSVRLDHRIFNISQWWLSVGKAMIYNFPNRVCVSFALQ